ncbi:MAG: hypothetical protein OIF48_02295 [Silicimonas sp.]|nr:hypothetical protein [Silicimonas sp.]
MPQPATLPALLTRSSHRRPDLPGVRFCGDLSLEPGRVHEICGTARRQLALMVAGALKGPVLWIRPGWSPVGLNPEGMRALTEPGRFLFAAPSRAEDLLWAMEESLRAGLIPLVVADLPGPPGLTAVRRLHLAAETGAAEGACVPLGLLLTPGAGGAPGVETRWSLEPRHAAGDQEVWALARRRARMAPEKVWRLEGGAAGLRLSSG